jgi:peptidoglycan hydrolase-like protein with peptidoglycan-binding domain
LRNTALTGLITLSAMAGSNALYNQSSPHPAPMFGSFAARQAEPAPVMPAERPAQLLATKPAATVETTNSIAATPEAVAEPIGNADVFEIQRKLAAFKLFDAKVDGIYGPRTARAIKAFEQQIGRRATGQLTPEIIAIIKATPITAEPAPPATATAETAPALELTQAPPAELALPAPEPLSADEAPATDESAGVTTLAMTSPPAASGPTKRVVPTIEVRADTAPAQLAMSAPITTPIDVTKIDSDPKVVSAVQRGLSSLGFLHGTIDGVAGEATAKAIRNFEVYYNYNVTGRITPELVNLLVQNGAAI